jgi:hypothetical protein
MDESTNDDRNREGSAEQRAGAGDLSKRDKPERRTQAGQEAAQDRLPDEHDREHHSNYGGGGPNGGTNP